MSVSKPLAAPNEVLEKMQKWSDNANADKPKIQEFLVREEDLPKDGDRRSSRITHFAAKIFSNSLPSSNAANVACKSGNLMLNNTQVSGGRIVQVGDTLTLVKKGSDRRTSVPQDPKKSHQFCASLLRVYQSYTNSSLTHSPLRVLYEDNSMAIVCKPAGIHTMSWSSSFGKFVCLDEILPLVLTPPDIADDNDEALSAPLPRHRLDQRVAGPVVVAKSRQAVVNIGRSFEEKTVQKEYRAIVVGEINMKSSYISSSSNGTLTINSDVDGKPSETKVVVLGTTPCQINGILTDLQLFPKTGRKHQLRIHCAQVLQTPIFGDDLYWNKDIPVRRRHGLYLYCRKVSIHHPLDSEKVVSGEITEPLRFTRSREKALKGYMYAKAEEKRQQNSEE